MPHSNQPTRRALLLLAATTPLFAVATEAVPHAEVYPTNIARSFAFLYQMQRGGIRGSSEFGWSRSGDGYEAHLKGKVAGFTLLDWASSGGFDAAGVAPRRYVEHRIGKSDRATVFRKADSRISFSDSPSDDVAYVPGAQDRLSWMIQLPAILAADPGKTKAGTRIAIYVVGTRGRADTWVFESFGIEDIRTPAGPVRAVRWTRTLRSSDESPAEVWVDPARKFLPVRLRLHVAPLDEPLEFTLADANW
jgi:hypothetical protein